MTNKTKKKQTKKKQTKKKQKQNKHKMKMKMMRMLPKQKKITPTGVILGLTYLDMLHHVQPQNDAKIIERQHEILKPFIKRSKNKTNKIKRGGHVFYYNVLPEVCALGAHNTDCQPSTLYYLGILTHDAATHLAEIIGEGQGHGINTMLEWFDEMFPEDGPHIDHTLIDFGDYYSDTIDGRNIYNDGEIREMNDYVMGMLHHILPFNQMGVMACISYRTKYDTDRLTAGDESDSHSICFIKDEYGQIVLVDSQSGIFRIIHEIHDIMYALGLNYLGDNYAGRLLLYVQENVIGKYYVGNHNYDPNNYSLPHNLNVERLFELTRRNWVQDPNAENESSLAQENAENSNSSSGEEEVIDNSAMWGQRQMAQQNNAESSGSSSGEEELIADSGWNGRQRTHWNAAGTSNNGAHTPYENAQWDDWYQRWYNSTGYYNEDGTYHYDL